MDLNREIRRAVDTGKVIFGAKQSEKSINTGQAKLFITASNSPNFSKERLLAKAKIANTNIVEFQGTNFELGQVCGKPFNISFMAIKEAGKSTILKDFAEKKEKKSKSNLRK